MADNATTPATKPDQDLVQESEEAIDAIRKAVKESLDVANLIQDRGYNWRHLLAALLMILTGGGIVFVAKSPVEVPPAPVPSPTPASDGVAKALEQLGPAIARAIDKQTDVLRSQPPSPSPQPIPPPQPPTSGLDLVPTLREVRVGEAAVFSATCTEPVTWHCEAKCDRMADGKLAVFIPTADGDFPVAVSAVIDGKAVVRLAMVRAGKGPQPPPKPVDPNDPPKPVDPVIPPVKPAPIAADGFRVLIVYETADLARMPREQRRALPDQSRAVKDFLDAHCVKEGNGWPSWRVWDKDVKFTPAAPKYFVDAMARERKSLPWAIISNGPSGGGYEGTFASEAELLSLLQKVKGK